MSMMFSQCRNDYVQVEKDKVTDKINKAKCNY